MTRKVGEGAEKETFETVILGSVKKDGSPDISDVQIQLPIPHTQMTVKQSVDIDQKKIKGRSGKRKQAKGYGDTEIAMSFNLADFPTWLFSSRIAEASDGVFPMSSDEIFEHFQDAFRSLSSPILDNEKGVKRKDVPQVYSIQSRATDLCGVKTVLFKELNLQDSPGSHDLIVNMLFVEFSQPQPPKRKRKNKPNSGDNKEKNDKDKNEDDSDEAMNRKKEEEKTNFQEGYDDGVGNSVDIEVSEDASNKGLVINMPDTSEHPIQP